MGLDSLPAWFLHVAAPVFCQPIAYLLNLLCTSRHDVYSATEEVIIHPIPKSTAPKQEADTVQSPLPRSYNGNTTETKRI